MLRRRTGRLAAIVALAAATTIMADCGRPSSNAMAPVGVRLHVDTTYYDVDGAGPSDWRRSLAAGAAAAGIAPYQAYTTERTRWEYASTYATPTGCELRQPEVTLEIHYVLPRLRADSAASPTARAEWNRFLTSLWAHEEGHALRHARTAARLRDTLQRLRAASCRTIADDARARAAELLDRSAALNKEYDARTRHGVRQGAFLIVDPRRPLPADTTYRDTIP